MAKKQNEGQPKAKATAKAKTETQKAKGESKAKAKLATAAEVPEVQPPTDESVATRQVSIVKREEDNESLARLEMSIQRDIQLSSRLDKAGAMVAIKIGLALRSAKDLLRHGEYGPWVRSRFGNVFSERKGQYYLKLAEVFLRSEAGAALLMPPPSEAGNWLVLADDGSQLHASVDAFVGDMTIAELLDKHGVRPVKTKGGYRPSAWLVAQYQGEHPHLQNKAFDLWPKEDREAFMKWQAAQVDGDSAVARRMAAEGTWHTVRTMLADHGLGRKTYALLPQEQLIETYELLAQVCRAIEKATKEE